MMLLQLFTWIRVYGQSRMRPTYNHWLKITTMPVPDAEDTWRSKQHFPGSVSHISILTFFAANSKLFFYKFCPSLSQSSHPYPEQRPEIVISIPGSETISWLKEGTEVNGKRKCWTFHMSLEIFANISVGSTFVICPQDYGRCMQRQLSCCGVNQKCTILLRVMVITPGYLMSSPTLCGSSFFLIANVRLILKHAQMLSDFNWSHSSSFDKLAQWKWTVETSVAIKTLWVGVFKVWQWVFFLFPPHFQWLMQLCQQSEHCIRGGGIMEVRGQSPG